MSLQIACDSDPAFMLSGFIYQGPIGRAELHADFPHGASQDSFHDRITIKALAWFCYAGHKPFNSKAWFRFLTCQRFRRLIKNSSILTSKR